MESNSKPTMFQTTLTWGLITGFVAVIYSLIREWKIVSLHYTELVPED
jgi:hypothetical protein